MSTASQRSFLGGIVSPAKWAQTDRAKRAYGLKDSVNFLIGRDGSLYNRPGSKICAVTKSATDAARIITMKFGGDDSVTMELGDGFIRFYANGVPLVYSSPPAWSATAFYNVGDMVVSGGTNYYCKAPNTNTIPPSANFWYAQTGTTYEIPSPWADEELTRLRLDGYADVRFFTQPGDGGSLVGRRVYQLKRVSKTSNAPVWTLTPLDFIPSIAPPGNIATSATGTGTTRRYKVSAVKKKTGEQSFAGNGAPIVSGTPDNTGAGGKIKLTATTVPATYTLNDDVLVVSVKVNGGTRSEAFEDALLGKIFNITAVVTGAGGHFDLDGTAGVTAAADYLVSVINLETPVLQGLVEGGLVAGTDFSVNIVGHGLVTGDEVYVLKIDDSGSGPQPQLVQMLTSKVFRVTKIDADNVYLDDTSGLTVFGGANAYIVPTSVIDTNHGASATVTLTWDAVPDAAEYWIFKDVLNNGVFGFIGKSVKPTYQDVNSSAGAASETVALTSDVPPSYIDPTRLNYPAAVAILQQRLVLAGGSDDPTHTRLSRAGNILSFSQSSPIQDDDSLDFSILGYSVESIMHALALNGRLFLFTSGDVWLVAGDADGIIRPDALNLQPTTSLGIGILAPLRVGASAIFTDSIQSRVRDIGLSQYGGYVDTDLSEYAPALVQGHTLSGWDVQELPDSIVYAARDDGQALALTFDRRNGTYAWSRMTTSTHAGQSSYQGFSVAREQGALYLYALVARTINSTATRFVERFFLRNVGLDNYSIASHAHFLDCEYSYDGTADVVTHLTITTGTTYVAGQTLTVTASTVPAGTTIFNSWDVGNRLVIVNGADSVTITITGYSSATVVTGTATVNVPASLQNVARLTWTHYYHVIGGLSLLEGEHLAALADGVDISNSQETLFTVASGVTTLTGYYIKVRAGLPITAVAETIGLDQGDLPVRLTTTPEVGMLVVQSRGWKCGQNADNLRSHALPNGLAATGLENGWMNTTLASYSDTHGGGVVLSQKAPLPACFMAAMIDVRPGGKR